MDEKNKAILQKFAEDERTFEVVKEALLSELDLNTTKVSAGVDNEELGEVTRAGLSGREQIKNAFIKIKRYSAKKETINKVNIAR